MAADRCSGEAAAEGASGPDADAAYWRALRVLLGAEIGERAASELELDWLQSHHRLVVWKLASQQRCLAHALGGGGFSVAGVVGQLAHRHRRERVQRHRSVLSRIEDGTDPPSVGMVLCVAAVRCEDGALELTDGWRCLWAALDARSGRRSHALQLALGRHGLRCIRPYSAESAVFAFLVLTRCSERTAQDRLPALMSARSRRRRRTLTSCGKSGRGGSPSAQSSGSAGAGSPPREKAKAAAKEAAEEAEAEAEAAGAAKAAEAEAAEADAEAEEEAAAEAREEAAQLARGRAAAWMRRRCRCRRSS